MTPKLPDWKTETERLGYAQYRYQFGRPFNLNIVGWRNSKGRTNRFDDFIALYWEEATGWYHRVYSATTKPGLPSLIVPIVKSGTAVLVPGQHRAVYELGKFKGYPALTQAKPLPVYRDKNRDSVVDCPPDSIETGLFGIHIHRAAVLSKVVGPWSAGCQVFQDRKDFDEFIRLCKRASKFWGNSFTYTLLEY